MKSNIVYYVAVYDRNTHKFLHLVGTAYPTHNKALSAALDYHNTVKKYLYLPVKVDVTFPTF